MKDVREILVVMLGECKENIFLCVELQIVMEQMLRYKYDVIMGDVLYCCEEEFFDSVSAIILLASPLIKKEVISEEFQKFLEIIRRNELSYLPLFALDSGSYKVDLPDEMIYIDRSSSLKELCKAVEDTLAEKATAVFD